jgi:hypothetical protein
MDGSYTTHGKEVKYIQMFLGKPEGKIMDE